MLCFTYRMITFIDKYTTLKYISFSKERFVCQTANSYVNFKRQRLYNEPGLLKDSHQLHEFLRESFYIMNQGC